MKYKYMKCKYCKKELGTKEDQKISIHNFCKDNYHAEIQNETEILNKIANYLGEPINQIDIFLDDYKEEIMARNYAIVEKYTNYVKEVFLVGIDYEGRQIPKEYSLIPDLVIQLKHLKSVSLVWLGDIGAIDTDFGQLKELRSFYIGDTKFSLKKSFNFSSKLKNLTISYTSKELTEFLINCVHPDTKLRDLDLNISDLKKLPKKVTSFTSLIRLSARECGLETLPEEIGNLTVLKELDLLDNNLKYLPISFKCLVNIREINLNYNRLVDLGDFYQYLTKLKYLSILDNNLKSLPPSFSNLLSLKGLSGGGNYIRDLPDMSGLPKFDGFSIDIDSETEEAVLEKLALLTQVKSLSIGSKTKLTKIPDSFKNLKNLEELTLKIDTENIPEFLTLLPNIKDISIDKSFVEDKIYHIRTETFFGVIDDDEKGKWVGFRSLK